MNKFVSSLNGADVSVGRTVTENGDATLDTSGKYMVDAFFRIGASRQSVGSFMKLAETAYISDPQMFARLVLYGRDVREGAGERAMGRRLMNTFFERIVADHGVTPDVVIRKMVEMGRWDDVLHSGDKVFEAAMPVIKEALEAKDGLCAKWMPRKGAQAIALRKYLGMNPKTYRKTLVELTNVVETKMCAKEWDAIDYNHIPSVAAKNYQKAFHRNDGERYREWIAALSKPDSGAKVNAGAIFPHDVLRGANAGVMDAQWKALPNYITENTSFLPMCDVSGSMSGVPMEVSVALGLYCSERNKSAFKDYVLTFSGNPRLIKVAGNTILDRKHFVHGMDRDWAMNTDIDKAFKLVLDHAVQNAVPQSDLPNKLIIFSDMQFDRCVSGGTDATMYQRWTKKFNDAGYEMPGIIFWNLRASVGSPVEFDTNGTALVSGFSPSILKNLLGGEIDPIKVITKTLMDDRYKIAA
ncbi:putative Ro sixty-related protein [Ochrobactrum phage vB_OspM_OC]|nr:putative Ro sixty-related protein [Ochrobactrum phage vB_OspM_OC]